MWSKCNDSTNCSSYDYSYSIKGEKVAWIVTLGEDDSILFWKKRFYLAECISKDGDSLFAISDNNLEILKIKVLLKLKEFGWKIKKVF